MIKKHEVLLTVNNARRTSFMSPIDIVQHSVSETIERIIKLTEGLNNFWESPNSWAPIEAAELLTKSRLDWQLSLAKQLPIFEDEDNTEIGRLILAWTTLGSLTEGTMKLFLSVYLEDYQRNARQNEFKQVFDNKGNIITPDELMLEKLRKFFGECVLPKDAEKQWEILGEINWLNWILKIQQRRNAIHTFKNRNIGNVKEFHGELTNYLIFLRKINNALPYPGDNFKPREF
jgi:hypothetical protein